MPRVRKGSGKIKFTGVEYLNQNNEIITPHCGQFLRIKVSFVVDEDGYDGCELSLGVRDMYGEPMMTFPTEFTIEPFHLNAGMHYTYCDINKLPLSEGTYNLGLWSGIRKEESDYIDSYIKMTVEADDFFGTGRSVAGYHAGKVVFCDHSWRIN